MSGGHGVGGSNPPSPIIVLKSCEEPSLQDFFMFKEKVMEIRSGEGCDNSPKNRIVENFSSALLSGRKDFLSHLVTEKTIFHVSGILNEGGTRDLRTVLNSLPAGIRTISFESSISHGKAGSSCGFFETVDNRFAFSIHLRFTTVKAANVSMARVFYIPTHESEE